MFPKSSWNVFAGTVIPPSSSMLAGTLISIPISRSVALIKNFPFFAKRRRFERIGRVDLLETAWFTKEIFLLMFSERKETFMIENSKFVVVVVYREKWKKARGRA